MAWLGSSGSTAARSAAARYLGLSALATSLTAVGCGRGGPDAGDDAAAAGDAGASDTSSPAAPDAGDSGATGVDAATGADVGVADTDNDVSIGADRFTDDQFTPEDTGPATDVAVVIDGEAGPLLDVITCPICTGETPVCLDGMCVPCAPGARRCAANAPQSCDAKGQWQDAPAGCSAPTPICMNGQCTCTGMRPDPPDPANCGACGHDCLGGECWEYQCQPIHLGQQPFSAGVMALSSADVYWLNMNLGVSKVPIQGGEVSIALAPPPNARFSALTTDGTYLYVGHATYQSTGVPPGAGITKINIAGGPPLELATLQRSEAPRHFATYGTNLYWSSEAGTINKIDVNGGMAMTIASGQAQPNALAADVSDVYWAVLNDGGSGTLMKVGVNGGTPTPLHSGAPIYQIEVTSDSVFWCSEDGIMKMAKSGGTPTALVHGRMFGFAMDSTYVYWNSESGVSGFQKTPLDASKPPYRESGIGYSIAVDANAIYWVKGGVNGIPTNIWKVAKI